MNDNILNNFLKWTATAFTLIGALLTSLNYHPINIYVLNFATIIWVVWSVRIKENSLIAVNLGALAIYALGLFIQENTMAETIKIVVLEYKPPKMFERTWSRKGYVASIGSKSANLKLQGYKK